MTGAGVIERIWRYPIKSTGGELLHRAEVEPRGLVGDRLFAVRDAQGKFGSGKNTRRFRRMPGLLQLSSRYLGDAGEPALLDPRGAVAPDPNACLRRHLGREDVEVVREGEISHFDRLPVSVPTTATLDWVRSAVPGVPVDERRFRPNLLVRTPPGAPPFVEDEWSGSKARIRRRGVRRVRAVERAMRDDRRGPAGPPPPLVLRAITKAHAMRLDGLATVVSPGQVRTGDPLVPLREVLTGVTRPKPWEADGELWAVIGPLYWSRRLRVGSALPPRPWPLVRPAPGDQSGLWGFSVSVWDSSVLRGNKKCSRASSPNRMSTMSTGRSRAVTTMTPPGGAVITGMRWHRLLTRMARTGGRRSPGQTACGPFG
ncbi:hypothetical protein TPA0909_27720 [Streptomyces albus]|nr:hypothetical protein TPA0909_27720 [Streptomyces albus]